MWLGNEQVVSLQQLANISAVCKLIYFSKPKLIQGSARFWCSCPHNWIGLNKLFITTQASLPFFQLTYGCLPVLLIFNTVGTQSLKVTCGMCHNYTLGTKQMFLEKSYMYRHLEAILYINVFELLDQELISYINDFKNCSIIYIQVPWYNSLYKCF